MMRTLKKLRAIQKSRVAEGASCGVSQKDKFPPPPHYGIALRRRLYFKFLLILCHADLFFVSSNEIKHFISEQHVAFSGIE